MGKRSQRRHGASESRRRILCRAQLLGRCSTTPMSGRHHDGAALKEQPHLSTSTAERGAKISHSQPLERCRVSTWDVKGISKRGGVPLFPLPEKGTSPVGGRRPKGRKTPGDKHQRGKTPAPSRKILRRGERASLGTKFPPRPGPLPPDGSRVEAGGRYTFQASSRDTGIGVGGWGNMMQLEPKWLR